MGCVKRELGGVEELAVEAELRAVAVDAVADDRVADRRHVDADLVRPAGLERHAKERSLRERLDKLEVRHRIAGAVGVERLARRVAPVAADRGLDPPGPRRRPPAHERHIGAPDPAPAKLSLKPAERLLVARHEQEARRVAVEAVDDAGPVRRPTRRPARERRRERRPRVAGYPVHEQAGRLHDDEEVIVGVDDLDVLGRERRCLRLGNGELDNRARGEPVGPRPHVPVHAHRSGVDQACGRGARADLGMLSEEPVEPHAAGVLGDDQLDGHGPGSAPAGGGGAGGRGCSMRISASASRSTPTTMKESARLNVGQWVMWMKSVTWPCAHAIGEVRDAPADEEAQGDREDRVARA